MSRVLPAQRVTNMDVDVCGKRASLQKHRVMKSDELQRVICRHGAGPLARRSRVEIGRAETDRVGRYLRRPAECPPARPSPHSTAARARSRDGEDARARHFRAGPGQIQRTGRRNFPVLANLVVAFYRSSSAACPDSVAVFDSAAPAPVRTSLAAAALTKASASSGSRKRSRTSSLPARRTARTNPR